MEVCAIARKRGHVALIKRLELPRIFTFRTGPFWDHFFGFLEIYVTIEFAALASTLATALRWQGQQGRVKFKAEQENGI